jgi:hypothetical protein
VRPAAPKPAAPRPTAPQHDHAYCWKCGSKQNVQPDGMCLRCATGQRTHAVASAANRPKANNERQVCGAGPVSKMPQGALLRRCLLVHAPAKSIVYIFACCCDEGFQFFCLVSWYSATLQPAK